jgi:hypothetical protein
MEAEKKVIAIQLYNGLCNRLLPLLACVRLARATNRRVVAFWMPNPSRCCLPYHGDTCNYTELFEELDLVEFLPYDKFYSYMNGAVVYDFNYTQNPTFILDMNTEKNIFIINCMGTLYSKEDGFQYIGYTDKASTTTPEHDRFISSYRPLFKELKPVESLQKRIDEIKSSFTDKMIGIHVRRSDGGFLYTDWTQSDLALKEKVEEWRKQGYSFFLASDDPKYESFFGDVIMNKAENKYNNDRVNTLHAVIDMYLLSHCNVIIGTEGSTFSIVAYFISENAEFWKVDKDPSSVLKINIQQ